MIPIDSITSGLKFKVKANPDMYLWENFAVEAKYPREGTDTPPKGWPYTDSGFYPNGVVPDTVTAFPLSWSEQTNKKIRDFTEGEILTVNQVAFHALSAGKDKLSYQVFHVTTEKGEQGYAWVTYRNNTKIEPYPAPDEEPPATPDFIPEDPPARAIAVEIRDGWLSKGMINVATAGLQGPPIKPTKDMAGAPSGGAGAGSGAGTGEAGTGETGASTGEAGASGSGSSDQAQTEIYRLRILFLDPDWFPIKNRPVTVELGTGDHLIIDSITNDYGFAVFDNVPKSDKIPIFKVPQSHRI